MEWGATVLPFRPPWPWRLTLGLSRERSHCPRWSQLLYSCLGPWIALWLSVDSLPSCHLPSLAFKNRHIRDWPMKAPPWLWKHEGVGMEWGGQCVRASFCSIYCMCISQEKDISFQKPGTTQDSEAVLRQTHQVGLLGRKLSYFSRDWRGHSVTLHSRSQGFKPSHTQIPGGREGGCAAIPIISPLPSPLFFLLNALFLFTPWSPTVSKPCNSAWIYLKVGCGFENTSPFQVSVVATFITHKRDREPQFSTEPLAFTLLYLFVYWFCHSSHWSPRTVSLLDQVCESPSFARKSPQV